MTETFEFRHPLVGLIDEITRLNGRLKSVFSAARRSVALGESELMVLSAVVEAERPPTVPQIGRSFGVARQIVQRAANALIEDGFLEPLANPDHKRAPLLGATAAGLAVKRKADHCADTVAADLAESLDPQALGELTTALHRLRKQLEAQLRGGEG